MNALIAFLAGVCGGFTAVVFIAKWSARSTDSVDRGIRELQKRNTILEEQTEAIQEISTAVNLYVDNQFKKDQSK